ncbi:hypothetical protein ACFQ6Q_12570, partial [Streptomyces sp. NPDC056437]|uniref:hypothetical protein n=1 Tax=Streptomyces sp. NPDC056437 TaxID=3345816 RepID=UPI003688D7BF
GRTGPPVVRSALYGRGLGLVIDYLRNGWKTAKDQDDRSYVERLAEGSEVKGVREVAEAALKRMPPLSPISSTPGPVRSPAPSRQTDAGQAAAEDGPPGVAGLPDERRALSDGDC